MDSVVSTRSRRTRRPGLVTSAPHPDMPGPTQWPDGDVLLHSRVDSDIETTAKLGLEEPDDAVVFELFANRPYPGWGLQMRDYNMDVRVPNRRMIPRNRR